MELIADTPAKVNFVRSWILDLLDELAQRREDIERVGGDVESDRQMLRCQLQIVELLEVLPAGRAPASPSATLGESG